MGRLDEKANVVQKVLNHLYPNANPGIVDSSIVSNIIQNPATHDYEFSVAGNELYTAGYVIAELLRSGDGIFSLIRPTLVKFDPATGDKTRADRIRHRVDFTNGAIPATRNVDEHAPEVTLGSVEMVIELTTEALSFSIPNSGKLNLPRYGLDIGLLRAQQATSFKASEICKAAEQAMQIWDIRRHLVSSGSFNGNDTQVRKTVHGSYGWMNAKNPLQTLNNIRLKIQNSTGRTFDLMVTTPDSASAIAFARSDPLSQTNSLAGTIELPIQQRTYETDTLYNTGKSQAFVSYRFGLDLDICTTHRTLEKATHGRVSPNVNNALYGKLVLAMATGPVAQNTFTRDIGLSNNTRIKLPLATKGYVIVGAKVNTEHAIMGNKDTPCGLQCVVPGAITACRPQGNATSWTTYLTYATAITHPSGGMVIRHSRLCDAEAVYTKISHKHPFTGRIGLRSTSSFTSPSGSNQAIPGASGTEFDNTTTDINEPNNNEDEPHDNEDEALTNADDQNNMLQLGAQYDNDEDDTINNACLSKRDLDLAQNIMEEVGKTINLYKEDIKDRHTFYVDAYNGVTLTDQPEIAQLCHKHTQGSSMTQPEQYALAYYMHHECDGRGDVMEDISTVALTNAAGVETSPGNFPFNI